MIQKTDKKKPKFRRTDWYKQPKLNISRKRAWRKPKGRHNKMRQRWKGHGTSPSVGYGNKKEDRGKIDGMSPIMIYNLNDLKKMKNNEIGIIGKGVGEFKKEIIAKKAMEMNVRFGNFSPSEFLNKLARAREAKKKEKEMKLTDKQKKEEELKKAAEKHEKESKEEKEKEKEEEQEKEKKDEEEMIKHEIAKPKHEMSRPHKENIHRIAMEK